MITLCNLLMISEQSKLTLPVFLMDDTLAEIDDKIKHRILSIIQNHTQLVYCTTHNLDRRYFSNAAIMKMEAGELVCVKRLVDIVNGLNMKDKSFKRQTMYRIIEEKWLDIFGQLAHALRFYYVKNKVLYISAKNPSWVNEISYYEASFIDKINQYLPG